MLLVKMQYVSGSAPGPKETRDEKRLNRLTHSHVSVCNVCLRGGSIINDITQCNNSHETVMKTTVNNKIPSSSIRSQTLGLYYNPECFLALSTNITLNQAALYRVCR